MEDRNILFQQAVLINGISRIFHRKHVFEWVAIE